MGAIFYLQGIWSIGVCSITNFSDIKDCNNIMTPVLKAEDVTDVNAMFVADPFVIQNDGKWYMFFEVYRKDSRTGVIGLATSIDGVKWRYERIVLEEEFHLSYPYVLNNNNKIYMIPETGGSGYVRVYEASEFPYRWKCIKNIIHDVLWDPSVFRFDGKWWLLALSNKPTKGSLRLYYSEDILSEWREHPKSPILTNSPKRSRPAGRIIYEDARLIRYSQDYSDYYGKSVEAFEITRLNTEEYKEESLGVIIQGSGKKKSWNKDGMHTIDINKADEHRYIAAVDGFYFKKFNKITEKFKGYLKAAKG